jgi:hypothetical protein
MHESLNLDSEGRYDDLTIFVIMPEEGLYNAEISKRVEEVACCYKPDL